MKYVQVHTRSNSRPIACIIFSVIDDFLQNEPPTHFIQVPYQSHFFFGFLFLKIGIQNIKFFIGQI